MTSLLLVSHGSRDPLAQETTARLARAVADALPGVAVGVGYLELASPSVTEALDALPRPVVVQPLLFTPAYHATTDLPAQVGDREDVRLAPALAPDPLLLDALDRRLAETGVAPDALVLVSAGTSDAAARALLDEVAVDWGRRHACPASPRSPRPPRPTLAKPFEACARRELRPSSSGRCSWHLDCSRGGLRSLR